MAGAAGPLKRAVADGPSSGVFLSISRSLLVACGPWLLTCASLVLISMIAAPVVSRSVVADFRGIIIYAFAISLVAAAPVVMVVTRVLSDAVYLGQRDMAQPVMVAGIAVSSATSAIVAYAVGAGLFSMPAAPLIVLVQAAGLTGLMWVPVAAANATRDYNLIVTSFLVGLVVATVACLAVAIVWHGTSSQMALAFNFGLAIIPITLIVHQQRTAPCPSLRFALAVGKLQAVAYEYRAIAAGGLLAAAAIWIDKWIMWAGPASRSLESGLVHSPLYDSAAFLATLTIIPGLTRFVTVVDGDYLAAYRSYFNAIKSQANLDEIERRADVLGKLTKDVVDDILILQAAICAIVILCAPQIVEAANLQFAQVSILRLCTLAVLFQLLFVASCSLLIFFDRHREFLQLQALFFSLSATGTALTLYIGPISYGFGLLAASVISGIAAYAVIGKTLRNLNYLTFVEGAVRMHAREVVKSTGRPRRWPCRS